MASANADIPSIPLRKNGLPLYEQQPVFQSSIMALSHDRFSARNRVSDNDLHLEYFLREGCLCASRVRRSAACPKLRFGSAVHGDVVRLTTSRELGHRSGDQGIVQA